MKKSKDDSNVKWPNQITGGPIGPSSAPGKAGIMQNKALEEQDRKIKKLLRKGKRNNKAMGGREI